MSLTENSPTKAEDGSSKSSSPKSSLEDASREDLIKQIKRQLILLQKTKNKCDELNKKCSGLEENLQECKENADESKDQAMKEHSILKDECESHLKKYREASEEIECMKSKESSLTSALTCLQEEVYKLSAENKDLKRRQIDMDSNKEKYDQIEKNRRVELEKLKVENEKVVKMLEKSEDTVKHLTGEIENLRQAKHMLDLRYTEVSTEMSSLHGQLDVILKEKNLLKEKCQDFDDMAVQLDDLRVCLDEIQSENLLLHTELKNAASERDQLLFQENREEQCSALEEQIQNLESEIEDLKNKLEGAEFEAEEMKAKLEEKNENCDTEDLKYLKMKLEAFTIREKQCREIIDDLFSPEDKFEFVCDEHDENYFVKKLNQVKLKVSDMQSEMEKLTFEIQDKGVEIIELQEKYCCNENGNSPSNVRLQCDEIELLKEEKQCLEDEFNKLKKMDLKHEDQLFACEEEMKSLKNLIKEKDEELLKTKSELLGIKSEFQNFSVAKEKELQELLDEKTKIEDEMKSVIKEKDDELLKAKSEFQSASLAKDKEIQDLINEKIKLEDEMKNLIKEKDDELLETKSEYENFSLSKEKEMQELLNEKTLLENEMKNLLKEKTELDCEINQLRSSIEKFNSEDNEKKMLEDEINRLSSMQNELRTEKEKFEAETNQLKNKLDENANSANNEFDMKLVEVEEKLNSANEEIKILLNEKTKIQDVLTAAEESVTILQNEKKILEDEVNKLNLAQDRNTKLEADIITLQSQLEEEKVKRENNTTLGGLDIKREEFEMKLNSANNEIGILNVDKEKFKTEMSQLKNSLEEEKIKIEKQIRDEMELKFGETETLRKENETLGEEIRQLNDKFNEFTLNLEEEKIQALKELNTEVEILRGENEQLGCEIIQLKNKFDEFKLGLEEEKIQAERKLNEEIETLRGKNEKLDSEIVKLKNLLDEEKINNQNSSGDEIESQLTQLRIERDNLLIRPDINVFNEMVINLNNIKEDLERERNISTKYKQELDKTVLDLAIARSQLMDLKAEKDCHKSEISSLISEKKETIAGLNAKISVLIFEKDKINSKLDDFTSESRELKESSRLISLQLEQEKERHLKTINQLEQVQQQFKQQKLTNLEFADYERLVNELNQQVKKLQEEADKLSQEMSVKEDTIKELRSELEQVGVHRTKSDERAAKLKLLLVKQKREIAELKRNETERNNIEIELRREVEAGKQKSETYQMDIAKLSNENQTLQDNILSMKESHQRLIRALELRVTSTQSELNLVRNEYEKCRLDYENYKVRVHSVLKQQKNKIPSPTNQEMDENERGIVEKAMDQLKMKLQEANDQSTALKTEYANLQDEYERLVLRYERCLEELRQRDEDFKEKLENLSVEETLLKDQHTEMVNELRHQNEAVTAAYKEQMHNMTVEHERVVKDLKSQLNSVEQEMWKWQRDVKPVSREEMEVFDVSNTERQEGEGSENTEPTLGTPVQYQADQILTTELTLEQLLNPTKKTSSLCSNVSQQEFENLEQQFVSCVRKVDHLTELLNESEASNMRLSEQTRVLKEEIRRLERNQEREEHTANMEYLKNVILKFVTLSGGDERERLVPVLTMMLRLSPQEKSQLNFIAKGNDQGSSEGDNVGWGGYLPRWSGLV